MGAARSGWSMLHQSAFLLALRNASPGTECASRTSVPHFLVDRPFAVVWLYISWLPRWRDSFRALGGSLFGVPSTDRGSRLRDMSNFCCLPGRAGGTPMLVSARLLAAILRRPLWSCERILTKCQRGCDRTLPSASPVLAPSGVSSLFHVRHLRRVDVVAHRTLRPLTHPAVSDRVLLSAGNQAPPWRFPCHCATITCRERIICMKALDRNSKPPNSRTVLVLDDDVLVRMPVVQFLRDCGYRVVEAASTDEAMAIFQKTNFHVDVVLSEIDIPGSINGFGFAQRARSVRPELKILLAGTPERTVRNAAELCEVGPTLKRPYDHKLVLVRIKRLLAARAQQGRR